MSKIKFLLIMNLLLLVCISVAAKDIKGNVESIDLKAKKININVNGTSGTYQVTSNSKLFRSLIETPALDVDLLSISPGDAIECSVDDNNTITKATASFNITRGTIGKIENNIITMSDGKSVKIAQKASISLENGNTGSVSDLVPGHTFVARTNPNTGDIWTLVVSGKVAPPKIEIKKQEVKVDTPKKQDPKPEIKNPTPQTPVAPKTETLPQKDNINIDEMQITSVEVSAPKNFLSGDLLLIKVVGTPHCGVSADIQYVAGTKVKLSEDNPGVYTGFITVPSKDLNYAKFVAYMSAGSKNISKISETVLHVKGKTGKLQNIIIKTPAKPVENNNTETTTPETPSVPETVQTPENTENNVPENPTGENTDTPSVENTDNPTPADPKTVEKKESEQISDSKDIIDQNTNKETITDPLRDNATIKIDDIKIVSPANDALVKDIQVSGLAIPDSNLSVKTIYSNGKNGVLGIKGILHEETIKVNSDGVFNYGPIQLEGFFATSGLFYYIEIQYESQSNYAPKVIRVIRE